MVARTASTRTPARKTAGAPQHLSNAAAMRGLDAATENVKAMAKDKAAAKTAAANTQAYVTTLKEAGGFHRKAFFIEMAVCLTFYAQHAKETESPDGAKVEGNVKKALRPIYEKAGYDAKDARGEDYKTVQRRIGAAADLYAHLGGAETIRDWTEDAKLVDAIHIVAEKLEKGKFDSIDAIRKVVGKLVAKPKPAAKTPAQATTTVVPQAGPAPDSGGTGQDKPAPQAGPSNGGEPMTDAEKELAGDVGKAVEARETVTSGRRAWEGLPADRILRTEHLLLPIPPEATQAELMNLASQIMTFAASMATAPQLAANV